MAGCPQRYVDSMEVSFLLKIIFFLLQVVRKQLGCTALLLGSKTIMMNVQTKMKAKQKQSLSRPARRELKLAQAKKMKNVSQSCTLMAAVAENRSLFTMDAAWVERAGGLCDLFTWEWRHCDPGGASGLTANRDRVTSWGRSIWSRFSHLVGLFPCSLFGSPSCEVLVDRLLASTTGLSWSLCLRHVQEGTRPNIINTVSPNRYLSKERIIHIIICWILLDLIDTTCTFTSASSGGAFFPWMPCCMSASPTAWVFVFIFWLICWTEFFSISPFLCLPPRHSIHIAQLSLFHLASQYRLLLFYFHMVAQLATVFANVSTGSIQSDSDSFASCSPTTILSLISSSLRFPKAQCSAKL